MFCKHVENTLAANLLPPKKPVDISSTMAGPFKTFFLSAGIDSEGHPANYVETEQIVQYNSAKASFVQVSRSIGAPAETQGRIPAVVVLSRQPCI